MTTVSGRFRIFLMKHPEAGDLIPDTGGLRKLTVQRCAPWQRQTRRLAGYLLLVEFWISVLAFHSIRQG